MDTRLLAFVGIAVLITITPGADMALVARVTLAQGKKAAWLTSCGIVSGLLVWGIASAAGISALLTASATLYTIVRLAGAVYLVVLGVQAMMSRMPKESTRGVTPAPLPQPGVSAFGRGLLNNLLNPKIGVFYSAFLPQFIAPGQPVFLMSVTLATIHAVLGILWLLLYATVLNKMGDLVRRPRIHQAMERVTGVVLIGLGLRLATERR